MPVQSAYTPDAYSGDGVTNAFTVTFLFQLPTDLVVQTQLLSTNAITTLTLGTDYSVTPAQSPSQNSPASTGTVTLLTGALPVGTDLLISRAVPLTQNTTWVPNDPNPSTSTMNAVDKLTMICQDLESEIQNIQLAPQTGIVTTAVFTIAAVNASQDVTVNSTTGLYVGNNIQISNVINTMYGQITAINALVLTVTTLAITSGLAGNNMPVGSPVQLASVPAGTATVNVTDFAISPSPASTLQFTGSETIAATKISNLDLYINTLSSGVATIQGYVNTLLYSNIIPSASHQGSHPALLGFDALATNASRYTCASSGQVLLSTSSSFTFGLISASNITTATLTPSLLNATNSPTDTYVLSYDLASTHFKWVPNTSSGVPGGGTTAQFLVGDATWSNSLIDGNGFRHVLSTGAQSEFSAVAKNSNGSILGTLSAVPGMQLIPANASAGNDVSMVAHFPATLAVGYTVNFIDTDVGRGGGQQVEGLAINSIMRAVGLRTTHGPWQFAYTINAPASSITVDLANGSYQRITSIANAVSITLADSTPAPSVGGWQFASELTLEINSPGSNTFTWPGTVTWANGISAPALSATGVNLIRLVRRQGQTQWIGYAENPSSSTYTDAQARSAVLNSTYLINSSSVQWNISAGVSAQPFIPNSSITGSLLAAGCINSSSLFGSSVIPAAAHANNSIPTNKLVLPGGSTVYMDGNGNFTAPAGGSAGIAAQNLGVAISGSPFTTINFVSNITGSYGGIGVLNVSAAGGSGTFSPATAYTWTANQTFQNALISSVNTSVPVTSTSQINGTQPTDGNLSGLMVNMQGTDGAYSVIDTDYILTSVPNSGINAIKNVLDIRANLNVGGFWIGQTVITQPRRINNGGASADALWFNAWSPMQQFSASADANGIIHSWTAGGTRIGEVNYGNAWADFGLAENRGSLLPTRHVIGMEFFPDHLPGTISGVGYGTYPKYNAQWATAIGYASAGSDGFYPQNWVGLLIDQNGIAPGGYGLRLWGSNGTFSTRSGGINASAATNAPHAIIKMSGTAKTGIDFAGTLDDATPLTPTATGAPAMILAEDMSIQFGTGLWLRGHSGALQYSTNGSSWSNVTLP